MREQEIQVRRWPVLLSGGWGCVFLLAMSAVAEAELTPDSPEVKRLIEKGMAYLEDNTDQRLGGRCLVGLCHLKHSGNAQHPRVAEAIAACERVCRADAEDIRQDIYSTGIAIFFLCEADGEKYNSQIERLVRSLVLRQKPGGGFGYPDGRHGETGDTSMTQYAVLGLWSARQHGIAVPHETVEKVANWLIRTQDPGGAWGYQGNDPGNYQRVKQTPLRPSLAAAGLGSTYISAHMLGLTREVEDRSIEGLPAAFQRVADPKPDNPEGEPKEVDPRRIAGAQADGNRWFSRNFGYKKETWVYYYMYALERCMSFRELVEGRKTNNLWYDRGVRFLEEQQQENGSWHDREAAVDTAFALLFLMRGTKKTIESTVSESYEGLLVGGRGLPKDTSSVKVDGGRLIGRSLSAGVEEMLAILEDPEHDDYQQALRFPPNVDLDSQDEATRGETIRRLRKIAVVGSPAAQVQAINLLARAGDLASVPTLISALSDSGDRQVVVTARDGLRRISRRFEGFGLSDDPSAAEVAAAAQRWRQWYRTISPEGS